MNHLRLCSVKRAISTELPFVHVTPSFYKPHLSPAFLFYGLRFLTEMGRGLPDGWLDYSKLGVPMDSEKVKARFISFKVPLKQQLTQSIDESQAFSPSQLISKCKDDGFNLGLIIDLTFTKRYYNPSEFTDAGIQYAKIPIEGQMVPKRARVDKFTETVRSFLKKNGSDDKVIGVHCTHGVNRTGYIICKYLVEQENMAAEDAIELFSSCRGHGIEREAYLNNLRTGHIPETEKETYYDTEYDAPQWKTRPQGNVGHSNRYEYYDGRHDSYGWRNHGHSEDIYTHRGRRRDDSYYYDRYSCNNHQDAYHRSYDPYYGGNEPYHRHRDSRQHDDRSYHRDDFSGSTSFDNRQHSGASGSERQRESDHVSKKSLKRSQVDESQETPAKRSKNSKSRDKKTEDAKDKDRSTVWGRLG